MSRTMISPEVFWQVYSAKLSELKDKELVGKELRDKKNNGQEVYEAYCGAGSWTPFAMGAAENTCKEFGLATSREYYRLDLAGYTEKKKEGEIESKWWLNLAYEHENDRTWYAELCKLCYVAADLRVISTYHDFKDEEPVTERLGRYINNLGKEKIFRVPNTEWLFIFGPRRVNTDERKEHQFKVFTIDKELSIVPIMTGEKVQPGLWPEQ